MDCVRCHHCSPCWMLDIIGILVSKKPEIFKFHAMLPIFSGNDGDDDDDAGVEWHLLQKLWKVLENFFFRCKIKTW